MNQGNNYRIQGLNPKIGRLYAHDLSRLYHDSVQHCANGIYSQAQCDAWSFAPRSDYYWFKQLSRNKSWLALTQPQSSSAQERVCMGFVSMATRFQERGYIEHLYVAPHYQRQGIAIELLNQLECWAVAQNYRQLTTDASALSKAAFLRQGFHIKHKTYQQKRGQILQGFYMVKTLKGHHI